MQEDQLKKLLDDPMSSRWVQEFLGEQLKVICNYASRYTPCFCGVAENSDARFDTIVSLVNAVTEKPILQRVNDGCLQLEDDYLTRNVGKCLRGEWHESDSVWRFEYKKFDDDGVKLAKPHRGIAIGPIKFRCIMVIDDIGKINYQKLDERVSMIITDRFRVIEAGIAEYLHLQKIGKTHLIPDIARLDLH